MKELTERQLQVLRFIQSYTDANTCPPTVRETAEYFSISLKAVQDHIAALRKKGYLSQSEKRSRSLKVLIDDRPEMRGRKVVEIPVIGTVAAGKPLFCDENFEGYVKLPDSMLSPGNKYFALHVRGSSMINAGILDGDLAIIRQDCTAQNGDIVVAVLDDSATLKRFFKEPTRIRLQPENPEFNPIYCKNVQIIGKLSKIIRSY